MRTTDMADELFSGAAQPLPAGVRLATARHGGVTVTRVEVAREGLSRPRGRYVTLEMPSVSVLDERDAAVIEVCARELRALLPPKGPVLVLGVGNRRITADALGPRTVQRRYGVCARWRPLRPGWRQPPGFRFSSWRRRWWGSCARLRWSAWTVFALPRGSGWGAQCSFRTRGFTRRRPTTPAT